jgi:PAS domain S-box-containing protein
MHIDLAVQPAIEPSPSFPAPDFRVIFDSTPTPLLLVLPDDPRFTVVAANDAYLRISRVGRDELLGRGVFEVFPDNPDDPGASGVRNLRGSFQRAIATQAADRLAVQRYDVPEPATQGRWFKERYWSALNTPIRGAHGGIEYLLHSVEEVTDQVYAEQREHCAIQVLRNNETRFRQLAETSTLGLFIADLGGDDRGGSERCLSYPNPAAQELLGYSEEEVAAGLVRWDRLTPPEFTAVDAEAARQLIGTGRCGPYEKALLRKNGEAVPVLVGASLLEPVDGRIEAAAFVLDLTERKRAEASLRKQRRTFDSALSNTPDFTYIFDLEGRFTYVNRALLSLWQKRLDEAVGKNFYELNYPPELAGRLQNQIQQVIAAKQPLRDETPFTGPTGETRHYEYIFVPVLSSTGQMEAVAGSTRDITERRQSQEALRKSEERLTFALAAGGGVGTWDWDIPSDRVYGDERFAELFSVDPQQSTRFPEFLAGIHPDDRDRVSTAVQHAVRSGQQYTQEFRLVPRGGAVRWVFARGQCHFDGAGNAIRFPGVVFDITERKRVEDALLESEARFRFLAESIPQMVWTAKSDGALDYVNSQGTEYFGLPQEALLGAGWLTCVHPDERQQTMERWKHCLATGEPYQTAFRLRRGSDGSWRWHLVRALALVGEVVHWFGTCTDIEDQKAIEAELTRTNRELEEFAYVASHDLQEPMRMVNIYSQLLLLRVGQGDATPNEQAEYAGFVRQGVARMEALI